jgi:hypothetical protein
MDLLMNPKDYTASSEVLSVINPLTNRKIKIGGKIYEELLESSCVYDKENNKLNLVDGKAPIEKSDDKVINPLTNRKIKVGGKIFESLLLTHFYNKNDNILSKLEEKSTEKSAEQEVSVSELSVPEEL